ncbi:hypothetical protein FGB62_333g08 [Gracilaria domingensis]|nr:hypothetical protein FGB62_405g010 [Gracilaria domingensis]KAI0557182.1 hypothetical protein FGB62_333g08 [Gracilaria domingensis]
MYVSIRCSDTPMATAVELTTRPRENYRFTAHVPFFGVRLSLRAMLVNGDPGYEAVDSYAQSVLRSREDVDT